MAAVDTLLELQEFLKIFNQTGDVFKAFVGDPATVENVVPAGQYAAVGDINTGALANALEFERRVGEFLKDMLFLDRTVGEFVDILGDDNTNNPRPNGYNDQQYKDFLSTKIIGDKESVVAMRKTILPLTVNSASQPTLFIESNRPETTMYLDSTFLDFFDRDTDINTGLPIVPARIGGDSLDGTDIYWFRVKLQPNNADDAAIIVIFLQSSHVAGVGFDIELYAPL